MTHDDSTETISTESSVGNPAQPRNEPPGKTEVISREELVGLVDHHFDSAKTLEMLDSLQSQPELQLEALSLQSSWNILSSLPQESPGLAPADQASLILRKEQRKQTFRSLFIRLAAFTASLACSFLSWQAGARTSLAGKQALMDNIHRLNYSELLAVAGDPEFLQKLTTSEKGASFAQVRRLAASDHSTAFLSKAQKPADPSDWDDLAARQKAFQKLPATRKHALAALAEELDRLPEGQQEETLKRLYGLNVWFESLSDEDRQKFETLSGNARWNRATRGVETLLRQKEGFRKQAFTITEFNRPDYIMDLATLTAAWMKMTPPEKTAFERRSRNMRNLPQVKTDRLQQLALAIDNVHPGKFPGLDLLRNNPPGRLAAKPDAVKHQREKKRHEYLELVRKSHLNSIDSKELESFQSNLPPWLLEVVDPLPPDEARRLLGILKILVDHQSTQPNDSTQGE